MDAQIKLCDPGCRCWHSREFVRTQLGISSRTLTRWVKDGMRISKKGMISCSWIREYYEREEEKPFLS